MQTVLSIDASQSPPIGIVAEVEGNKLTAEDLRQLGAKRLFAAGVPLDEMRARLGHAYASTIYGCQGLTTDRAFVLLDPTMNRHDIYVAASRARVQTQLFLNRQACDAHIKLELPLSERHRAVIDQDMRMAWLAARLARAHVKSCTLDPTLEFAARSRAPEREQSRSYDRG